MTELVRKGTEVVGGKTVDYEIRIRRDGTHFKSVSEGGFLQYICEVEKPEPEDDEG
ncbi:hypothetical protein LCGC14_0273280 [marine sediment metagenome]|uniref:Uncharacterized protein n=1 Tax=marine sediment metagenome TaxID=412755 RepID=A0A0F9WIX6_9ZZZZ